LIKRFASATDNGSPMSPISFTTNSGSIPGHCPLAQNCAARSILVSVSESLFENEFSWDGEVFVRFGIRWLPMSTDVDTQTIFAWQYTVSIPKLEGDQERQSFVSSDSTNGD
jgi:hypothetical protein